MELIIEIIIAINLLMLNFLIIGLANYFIKRAEYWQQVTKQYIKLVNKNKETVFSKFPGVN